MFLKMGITFEILREDGNFPVEKERFTRSAIGFEISAQTDLRILMGTLLGPELLEGGIELIIFTTSSGVTGVKKIEFKFGLCKNDEKCFSLSGI